MNMHGMCILLKQTQPYALELTLVVQALNVLYLDMLVTQQLQLNRLLLTEIHNLINELSLPSFDILLIGDGSGTVVDTPCGYACFGYEFTSKEVNIFYGGTSNGTNNFAELIPYINALWYYNYKNNEPSNVLIVSDSELTVRHGNRQYSRNSNKILWASLNYLESIGYNIVYKHVARNSNPVNKECDRIAGEIRKMLLTQAKSMLECNQKSETKPC
jgi:ribonuclease HI